MRCNSSSSAASFSCPLTLLVHTFFGDRNFFLRCNDSVCETLPFRKCWLQIWWWSAMSFSDKPRAVSHCLSLAGSDWRKPMVWYMYVWVLSTTSLAYEASRRHDTSVCVCMHVHVCVCLCVCVCACVKGRAGRGKGEREREREKGRAERVRQKERTVILR